MIILFCFKLLQKSVANVIFCVHIIRASNRKKPTRNLTSPKVMLFICLITALRSSVVKLFYAFRRGSIDFLKDFIL